MKVTSEFIPNVNFELIPIKNLVSNQEYQRCLSHTHIKRMTENFDIYQINPVKISRRDGQNLVMNGQHTIETIAAISDSRETPVWCMVYDDLDYIHEAKIFASQQEYTKSLSAYEIFNAKIEADSDEQIIIKSIVEENGLKIVSTRCSCGLCAVNTLEEIFRNIGFHGLDRTLKLIVGAWEGENSSLSSNMFNGVALLISTYGDSLKNDAFIQRVGTVSAREIARIAKERRNGSLGYAEVILSIYNKKTKAGLMLSSIYSTEKQMRDNEQGINITA